MAERDIDLQPDALVARLMPNYDTRPDVVMLVGFLGDGPAGHRRIYATPDLRKWIEIKDEDIVARERISAEQGLLGGRSVIFVKGEAMRAPLQDSAQQLEGSFLTGSGLQLPETLEELAKIVTLISEIFCEEQGHRPSHPPPCRDSSTG